ncbi:oxaloacetate tautomerase fahd2, mitochondrial-like [Leptinotarsa decemlineata]|uniref:oxaloacetate tautomerase fahd2, mitochondrial-like n=1 Tax=Leptinotarsa decemlineata TaxID=7539 RepID=UPI003D309A36
MIAICVKSKLWSVVQQKNTHSKPCGHPIRRQNNRIVTLYPGDVILTGTPAGVGMHRNPPEFLKKGIFWRVKSKGLEG